MSSHTELMRLTLQAKWDKRLLERIEFERDELLVYIAGLEAENNRMREEINTYCDRQIAVLEAK